MGLQAQPVVRTAGEQLQAPLADAEAPAEQDLHEHALRHEPIVGVCNESLLPEEVHIFQDLAAHEDGREILNHVGKGELFAYPFDSQCFVNQIRLTGGTELADDVKNSVKAIDLLV